MVQPGRPRNDDLRQRFFDAGLGLLADEGYAGLKLATLVGRLGVSTGAFYHSFASWADYTTALLDHWYDERTVAIGQVLGTIEDPHQRVLRLREVGLQVLHATETAIRTWAAVEPQVAAVVARVDAQRIEIIRGAYLAWTGDETLSRRTAVGAMYLLVGYEQAPDLADPETLGWALDLIYQHALHHVERDRTR